VSPITVRSLHDRMVRRRYAAGRGALVAAGLLALILVAGGDSHAPGAQSRQECNKCCERKGFDEFFLEECKLKCFKNPEHCVDGGRSSTRPTPEPEPAQPTQPAQPAQPTQPSQSRPRTEFRWPQPLSLTPGNEWEAAAQILSLNGITPQHPNALPALQAVEAVLLEFVRSNPSGGRLPTEQLEQIIRRFR